MKSRLTFANVASLLALVLALTGGAYAAGLARNSVKSKQIKAGAVKTAELADGSVTSPKIADGALQASDFASGQLPRGATGPQGTAGTNGTNGTPGTPGTDGVDGTARGYVQIDPSSCNAPPTGGCAIGSSAVGVTSVRHISTGHYCIVAPGLSSRTEPIAVTVDSSSTSTSAGGGSPIPGDTSAMYLSNPGGCQNTTDFEVSTTVNPNRTADAGAGTVIVQGLATESDLVGFSVVIP